MDTSGYDEEAKKIVSRMPVGTKFKHNGYLKHVLAIVDEDRIVVKYFGKHKQWWHYEVLEAFSLAVEFEGKEIIIK